MEELRNIAKAHYQAGSQQVQTLAHKFFNSMDSNDDGRIELGEFLEFTSQKCRSGINSHSFFKKLDRDGNGTLDFWEVMTLYYIIKSGRPFCSYCDNFIPGVFFSCVGCSFTLCVDCYLSSKCDHNHNGRAQFLDNYTLLQVTRDSAHETGIKQDKVETLPTWMELVETVSEKNGLELQHMRKPSSSHLARNEPTTASIITKPYPTSIVLAREVNKWNVAFKAFEVSLAIGNIAGTMCTIL